MFCLLFRGRKRDRPEGYEKRDVIATNFSFTPNLASRSPSGRSLLSLLNNFVFSIFQKKIQNFNY
jgi:hypothetical protein